MAYGYWGKVLRINLTTGKVSYEKIEEDIMRTYIGGSGLGAKFLIEETDGDTDPLGPDNILAFMTGPFTGTRTPNGGRFQVTAKSPLTGGLGEANSGGTFGPKLKYTGVDGLILCGRSDKPVHIFIDDNEVKINDAAELWGKDTFEIADIMTERYGKKQETACIGPAGENLVKFACIMHDGREARTPARTGLGAVMGSKNVKAITVLGTQRPETAMPEEFRQSMIKWAKTLSENSPGMRKYGTGEAVEFIEAAGDLPIKNWKEGQLATCGQISGVTMTESGLLKKSYSCAQCTIGCGRVVEIKEGPYACEEQGGPEYETIGCLGSNLMVDDLEVIQMGNSLCNKLGMDTISTGGAIAFAMEAFEEGVLTEEELGGRKIRWGEAEDIRWLIEAIAAREGIGDILAEGARAAGKRLGGIAEEFAVEVKGLEFPAHDPRAGSTIALQYATSTRGACHCNSNTHPIALTGETSGHGFMPPQKYDPRDFGEDTVNLTINYQDANAMMDSMPICKFAMYSLDTEFLGAYLTLIKQVAGWDMDKDEFMEAGRRIVTLKRAYQVKCGVSRKDDRLPPRMSKRRMNGGMADHVPKVEPMLDLYYEARGWDTYGRPTTETLKKLSLEWIGKL
ncbi:MAG: aldehyde ferredoxin oxidoreductase family protein [Spirochaetales bacterium]|uniref:Aldehyde ferredoxin oxidoreductase family protein n=1 Tax=Candidatus Thalassospirochaeta sargassi TaxID=3119039 RepID=A0AAJ1MKH2_9SPIO|nr:aldehyde ferredoxin oxidoreductase family protein [Spirochaetales bacterium]